MQILLDTQKCYGSSYPWSCPTALLVKKPRKKYSQLLLSATCNPDLLPSVTNSHWPPIYSNTDLVPGTTATIECFEGFHFHGTPVAINTPVLGCFKMQKVKISRWGSPKIGYYTKLSHCKRNWDFSCKIVAPRNFFVFNGDFGFF